MYAIIETGGKQYRVEEGSIIDVERLEGEAGAEVDLSTFSSKKYDKLRRTTVFN